MCETPQNPNQDGTTILDLTDGLLGLVMVASGVVKLVGEKHHVGGVERWGHPEWARVTTDGTAILDGPGLLAGFRFRLASVLKGTLIIGTMTGAVCTHLLRVADPLLETAKPGPLLTITALIVGRESRRRADAIRERTND